MTKQTRWRPPGKGFVLLVLLSLATGALLWWGLSTPAQEALWWDLTAVRAGRGGDLPVERLEHLMAEISRTPTLARELVGDRRGAFLTARAGHDLPEGPSPLLLLDEGEPPQEVVLWFSMPEADATHNSTVTVDTGAGQFELALEGRTAESIACPALKSGVPTFWTVTVTSGDEDEPLSVRGWLQPVEDRDE